MSIIKESLLEINSENLTHIFSKLKALYNIEKVEESRKIFICEEVRKYGYLPYPHIKALQELTEAETIIAFEEKLKLNNTYNNEKFNFNSENISAVNRAGFKNSEWINKENHNIKLINLAGLGNGNKTKEAGKFIDWLKQLVTLPSGNIAKGILSTTMYLIPFHPREFGCAYLPKSSEVSENLESAVLKEKLWLDAKNQVRLFIAFAQLAGHPVIYDVLPQTGRFSKTVLAATYVARWFDVKDLIKKLTAEINNISKKMEFCHNPELVERVKNILEMRLSGIYAPESEELKDIYAIFSEELIKSKKEFSNEMLSKENQEKISIKAKQIICNMLKKSVDSELTEEDITCHGEIIGELIKEGLWPAPGGAWCSSGVPVFDEMSEGAGYPMFRHFDNKDKDVTNFANLDCQTPYYFAYFDKKEYNKKVIDFYVNFLKKLRHEYNFDGFRVDHIDHIVDEVSQKDGFPISYRAPSDVLGFANTQLKKEVPHFATLAEYMLWDNFYKEYHTGMNFDLLWGNDIISQYQKTVSQVVKDNEFLEKYNKTLKNTVTLSILKAYNNQDGEFREINQYPGQLGEDGALFKWFKFKFLPGGEYASRPVMFLDGDESYTQKGIEATIGAEESMLRNDNYEFFRKFDAINRFALNNEVLSNGRAEIVDCDEKTGFISWLVTSKGSKEGVLVAANEKPPTEVTRNEKGEVVNVENKPVLNIKTTVPKGFSVVSEYILPENSLTFSEKSEINNLSKENLSFKKLNPAEFHIYKVMKK